MASHANDGIIGQFGRRRPGKSGKSYRSALDLWLGEALHIKGVPIPYGAPNAAAHIERFMGSLRRECLNHFVFISEDHLRRTVVAYIARGSRGRHAANLMNVEPKAWWPRPAKSC